MLCELLYGFRKQVASEGLTYGTVNKVALRVSLENLMRLYVDAGNPFRNSGCKKLADRFTNYVIILVSITPSSMHQLVVTPLLTAYFSILLTNRR